MNFIDRLLSIVAPHECVVCGQDGTVLCAWCWPEACQSLPSRCYNCKAISRDSAVCPACRHLSKLKSVWVRTEYDGYAKQLIHLLKFSRVVEASPIIAQLMGEALPFLTAETVVVPVPTAMSRRRQRGYDQAELIAKSLALDLGLNHSVSLRRTGKTRQLGASRKQRLEQLVSAFSLPRPKNIIGKDVLLVDDIATTGATLETAAQVLKDAGARKINAVVFAQKL